MIQAGTVFVGVAIILVMATLGAVLLVSFVAGSMAFAARVAAAAGLAPFSVFVPVLVSTEIHTGPDWLFGLGAIALVVIFGSILIGWPIAHFATLRLDSMLQQDSDTFE